MNRERRKERIRLTGKQFLCRIMKKEKKREFRVQSAEFRFI